MRSSLMMALLMSRGLMGGLYSNTRYITYANGNDTKAREVDIKKEYELIKQKKSTLSANVRLQIVRAYEQRLKHLEQS